MDQMYSVILDIISMLLVLAIIIWACAKGTDRGSTIMKHRDIYLRPSIDPKGKPDLMVEIGPDQAVNATLLRACGLTSFDLPAPVEMPKLTHESEGDRK